MAQAVPGPSLITALIVGAVVQGFWKRVSDLPQVVSPQAVVDPEETQASTWLGALQSYLLVLAFGVGLGVYLWARFCSSQLRVNVENRQQVTLGIQQDATRSGERPGPRFARRGGGRLEGAPSRPASSDIRSSGGLGVA